MDSQNDAFVILPFEEPFEGLYEDILSPALEEKGYRVNKADSQGTQRNIVKDVVEGISTADLLIADLTDLNPNVFYELGIAHTQGVPTILITQDLGELPFDLEAYTTIEYSLKYDEADILKEEIKDIGERHAEGNVRFGSPVSDHTDIEIAQQEAVGESADGLEDRDDENSKKKDKSELNMGILDYASESDGKISELEENLDEISEETVKMGSNITSHAQQVQKLEMSNRGDSHKRANMIARDIASDLKSYAGFVDERITAIDDNLEYIMDAQQAFIEFADPSDDEHYQALENQEEELRMFTQQVEHAMNNISDFHQELSELKGLNRELNTAVNELSSTLSTLLSILEESSAKAERYSSLIRQDLNSETDNPA
jgi:prefoldin subunit 5